jgi:anti-sigma regulatory factor (Ser/Thr protein kinase)
VDSLSKLEAIAAAWEGIAEINLSFENDVVESSTFPIAVTLIQEGISNAIRHSSATVIGISGFIYEDSVRYVISSDGEVKKERGKGLGTVLFDELTNNWSLKRLKDSNQLQFDLNK